MTAIVATKELSKQYGKIKRVDKLNLVVPEGVVYGFLGPNGAGKSTTLKMLLGLVRPTAGEISLFGQNVHSSNRLQILRQVGALIESPSYYGHLTGEENLRILQKLRDVPERNVREVLRIVRLDGQRNKKVSHYSLGMKQRLGLAGALLAFPQLLILDEPTNGLDPAGIQELRELICSLPEKYGMTVLLSSHLLSEIDQMADEVGIIRDGKLIFQDKLSKLHAMGQRQLALRTDDNLRAVSILSSYDIPVQYSGQWLLLPQLDDVEVAACGRMLMQQHIHLLRLEERQKSLEDIFLALTEEGGVSMKQEIRLEFFKMRGRCWWLVLTFLMIQGTWMWWCMRGMRHYEIVQGWQHYLYNLPVLNAILLPVLMAVIASRSADLEWKGQMLRQLFTVQSAGKVLLAKLFYGGWQILCLLAGQMMTMLLIGLYKGFYGPIPWSYFGCYVLFTVATTLCIYLVQLFVSLLVRNQVIPLVLGLAGGFCGLFSLFLQQHWLSKLVLWTYYSQLYLCSMNWDEQTRVTDMYWLTPNWGGFAFLTAGFLLTLWIGRQLLARREW